MNQSTARSRILVLRLSALGDIILCSAALSAILRVQPGARVDWVISSTWRPVLEGDPRIERLISFDRGSGLAAWHRLCRGLFSEGYDEVLDLHGSLRTRYARLYFLFRRLADLNFRQRWRVLSKGRWKRAGFFIFKKLWPERLRPGYGGGLAVEAARIVGGSEADRPDLSFLLKSPPSVRTQEWLDSLGRSEQGFVTVMPGSAWPGKRWPLHHWVEMLGQLGLPVVILGTERDPECEELAQLLEGGRLRVVRAFEAVSLRDAAHLIHASRLLISNDTGLVHLAEAIGKPVVQLFGPTHPGLGFGAWRQESKTLGAELWCRPCSKDGSICFRRGESRFLCQELLTPVTVRRGVESVLSRPTPAGEGGRMSLRMTNAGKGWAGAEEGAE